MYNTNNLLNLNYNELANLGCNFKGTDSNGNVINNGYVILDTTDEYAFGYNPFAPDKYVVWLIDKFGNYNFGSYFSYSENALADYVNRTHTTLAKINAKEALACLPFINNADYINKKTLLDINDYIEQHIRSYCSSYEFYLGVEGNDVSMIAIPEEFSYEELENLDCIAQDDSFDCYVFNPNTKELNYIDHYDLRVIAQQYINDYNEVENLL